MVVLCRGAACTKPILCAGGPDVILKEAWPFYRTILGVRLCWELEEDKEPKGPLTDLLIARTLPGVW